MHQGRKGGIQQKTKITHKRGEGTRGDRKRRQKRIRGKQDGNMDRKSRRGKKR